MPQDSKQTLGMTASFLGFLFFRDAIIRYRVDARRPAVAVVGNKYWTPTARVESPLGFAKRMEVRISFDQKIQLDGVITDPLGAARLQAHG